MGTTNLDALTLSGALAVTGATTQTGALTITGLLTANGGIATDTMAITAAAIGATNDRAMKISSTQATPNMADGYGVIEKELTITGTATGLIAGESSWINLGTSAVIPSNCFVHNDGIWDGTATLTTAVIAWAKYQCILSSNPLRSVLWDLNFSGANSEIDAMFQVNDGSLALGYAADATTDSTKCGDIPFMIDSNGSIKYIRLYDAAS